MSRTSVWTGLRGSFVALGLVAGVATAARADSIQSNQTTAADLSTTVLGYDTAQSYIENKGITGDANALKIIPVAGGTFLTPSFLSLGAFQSANLDAGQSTTFNNTPFHFKFAADSINGQTGFSPNDASTAHPLDLSGVLNGTLNGPNQSSVTATFGKFDDKGVFQPYTSSDEFKFSTGLYNNSLKLPNNPVAIVPYTTNNGLTTAQAFLTNNSVSSPVPEPSTVVLFAATAAGLGFRHRLRKARAAAGAA